MNVLIIGVSGFLGRAIASSATMRGLNVFGLSRSKMVDGDIAATYLTGDRNLPDCIANVVYEQHIDVVVDVIAMTLDATKALMSELDGRISQYVMLSSSDVYRNYELLHRKAVGTPTRLSVDEDSELRSTRYPYRGEQRRKLDSPDQYLDDYDKIPIEQAVRQLSSNWTVLRLPMVYGPGDRQRRFRWAIEPMAKHKEQLVIPRVWADAVSTYGYVENVGAAISTTLGDDHASKQVFNVAESNPTCHFEWANRIATVMDWNGKIKLTDDPANSFAQRLERLDLTVPFRIDDSRIRNQLGYSEVVDETECLKRTVLDEIRRL